MSGPQLNSIVNELDYEGNGKINYSEFLSATIDHHKFLTEQRLHGIFHQFDVEGSDKLTASNLQDAFQKLGQNLSMEEIERIIKKHDLNGDGCLDFEEFKVMFHEDENMLCCQEQFNPK